ncbi:hypothetical protein ACFUJU_07730 [Streptomyces sp. NPDC057235]|uniref:hypothetical protein n=1 Tax=Streptomyces sp. NPDC057235 TaxID=3346058 RepID=UPI003637F321
MTRLRKLLGPLRGGLSRITGRLRLDLRREDAVWALMGCLVGAGIGLLFTVVTNR